MGEAQTISGLVNVQTTDKWKNPNQTATELAVEDRATSNKISIKSPNDQQRN